MTELTDRPWTAVEIDFCGPFPNGKYALVVIDEYPRYQKAEFTTTTSFEASRKKLKKVFLTHGNPQTLQTDNGPPFKSLAIEEFAKQSGFNHKSITPRHPKAQCQVEGFKRPINKIMAISKYDRIDPEKATYDMLQAYRSTPHPATKLPPYQLLMNRQLRTKLDHFQTETQHNDKEVRERNSQCKRKHKEYHDKRHKTTTHTMTPDNAVIVKCENKRKGQTLYEPYIYVVIETKGSQITAKKIKDGRTILRNATKFNMVKTNPPTYLTPQPH